MVHKKSNIKNKNIQRGKQNRQRRVEKIQRTKGSWIGEIDDIRYSYMDRGKTWRDLKVMMIRRGATLQEY